jgi:hypothetical protein
MRVQGLHLNYFIGWAGERGVTEPVEATRSISEARLRLPQTQRRTAELHQPAEPAGPAAHLVPLDGAAALHPAQPGERA